MRPVRAQRKPDEGPVFVGALIGHDAHELARLVALVPPPRVRLTHFHGVSAPHSQLRTAVTPAHRGVTAAKQPVADPARPPPPRHAAMNWAKRLKRVFGIEIDACQRCGAWPMSWHGWTRSGWPSQLAAI